MSTVEVRTISLSAARDLVRAGCDAASERDHEMTIAVVDAVGDLKVFERMDGAAKLSIEIAINKAWTAAVYGISTADWNAFLQSDPGVAQIAHTPRLVTFAGGVPITVEGNVVGAIGVSGGHYSEDQEIANKAIDSLFAK